MDAELQYRNWATGHGMKFLLGEIGVEHPKGLGKEPQQTYIGSGLYSTCRNAFWWPYIPTGQLAATYFLSEKPGSTAIEKGEQRQWGRISEKLLCPCIAIGPLVPRWNILVCRNWLTIKRAGKWQKLYGPRLNPLPHLKCVIGYHIVKLFLRGQRQLMSTSLV